MLEDGKPIRLHTSRRRVNKLLQLLKSPTATMTDSATRFGFVAFAETWNGRLAMLGFVIGLATEVLTGQSILSQIGLG
jgi:ferrochelatase